MDSKKKEEILKLVALIEEYATERTYMTWDYYTLKLEETYKQLEDLLDHLSQDGRN